MAGVVAVERVCEVIRLRVDVRPQRYSLLPHLLSVDTSWWGTNRSVRYKGGTTKCAVQRSMMEYNGVCSTKEYGGVQRSVQYKGV